jgi:hypothetical protein
MKYGQAHTFATYVDCDRIDKTEGDIFGRDRSQAMERVHAPQGQRHGHGQGCKVRMRRRRGG